MRPIVIKFTNTMKVIITGAAGFLGSRLAAALLSKTSQLKVTELILTDLQAPPETTSKNEIQVKYLRLDLTNPKSAEELIGSGCDIVFHLAAAVSGIAEDNFDLGMKINLDGTRYLLEAIRNSSSRTKFVFASSVAVFGGDLPLNVNELTALMPSTSYGTAKAMCEMLISDYSRRGYVNGCSIRLPIVTVRAGTPNTAMTSFISGIIREPLKGIPSVSLIAPEQKLWVSSPATVTRNMIHAATLSSEAFGGWRSVNLPGISVSINEMLVALKSVAGEKVYSLVSFKIDERLSKFIAGTPNKLDVTRALKLGFYMDYNYEEIIKTYINEDM